MITVHHLSFSRSHRVLWLLEELGLPCNLVRHERDANFKAPPSLAKVHPLGKAPVIEDDSLVIAESAVILSYINARYGKGRLAPPAGSDAFFQHEEWLQYAESTAAFPIMLLRIGALTGGLSERTTQFVRPTLLKTLDHICTAVQSAEFLTGDIFTLADIQIVYPLEIARRSGLLEGHRALVGYLDRLAARPAFAKAVEIGGPMLPPETGTGA